jgi:hypothetical protein
VMPGRIYFSRSAPLDGIVGSPPRVGFRPLLMAFKSRPASPKRGAHSSVSSRHPALHQSDPSPPGRLDFATGLAPARRGGIFAYVARTPVRNLERNPYGLHLSARLRALRERHARAFIQRHDRRLSLETSSEREFPDPVSSKRRTGLLRSCPGRNGGYECELYGGQERGAHTANPLENRRSLLLERRQPRLQRGPRLRGQHDGSDVLLVGRAGPVRPDDGLILGISLLPSLRIPERHYQRQRESGPRDSSVASLTGSVDSGGHVPLRSRPTRRNLRRHDLSRPIRESVP